MASKGTNGSRPSAELFDFLDGPALPSKEEMIREFLGRDPRAHWQRRRSEKQILAECPDGPLIPAGLDPNRNPRGRFVKGHSVRSGGPKRKRATLLEAVRISLTQFGDDFTRQQVAKAVGCKPEEVPTDLSTDQDFMVWMMKQRALGGCIEAFREIFDRSDPKPQRIVLDASLTAKRSPISGQNATPDESQAADDYYSMLSADSEDYEDAEYEELPEPSRSEGEADLSFLE